MRIFVVSVVSFLSAEADVQHPANYCGRNKSTQGVFGVVVRLPSEVVPVCLISKISHSPNDPGWRNLAKAGQACDELGGSADE